MAVSPFDGVNRIRFKGSPEIHRFPEESTPNLGLSASAPKTVDQLLHNWELILQGCQLQVGKVTPSPLNLINMIGSEWLT